ncbi:pentapeptide repeat-containing protein [Robbsia andropogonis]|uniref:pentapeptide repeat-containing protein n=1 Tax=Robbsia andropogonis TaxID=28092 RepID=UPI003D202A22
MKIQILNRWSLKVVFEHDIEGNTLALTVKAALSSDANLRGADLRGANLRGADLRGADLRDADLRDADLRGANLRGADLRDANLRDADLSGANLRGAYLRGADLRDANLRDADLSGANLRGADLSDADLRDADLSGANLSGANLRGADLSDADLRGADLRGAYLLPIKADFIEIISQAPREVPALIEALKDGRVDGSTYRGECACLVGTIAQAQGLDVDSADFRIPRDESRPAERFFIGIRKGDTPENNQASALALEWASAWLTTQRAAFGSTEKQS